MTDHQPPTLVQKPTHPERIGPYLVEGELGQGGMGTVFRGHDPHLDRAVAIKVLHPHLARDREFAHRFLREARTAARIEHPGVVSVYAADDLPDGQGCYLAMQFVDGIELHRLVRDRGALPVDLALSIARDVASALGAAHEQGIVHRDVKPDNVLVDRTGRIRVTDFGLARPVGGDVRLTETGVFLGTPEYSAPEQCQTEAIDHRADLYSLGVVLYEMLSGQLPHKAPTPYALFQRIVEERPIDLRTLNDAVPRSVEALVMDGLLAKRPQDRVESAAALVARIDAILADLGAARKDYRSELAAAVAGIAGAPRPSRRVGSERESHETIPYVAPRSTWAKAIETPRRKLGLAAAGVVAVLAALLSILLAGRDPAEPGPTPSPAAEAPAVTPEEPPRARTIEEWLAGLEYPVRTAVLDFRLVEGASADADLEWYRIALTELVITELCAYDPLLVLDRNSVHPHAGLSDRELSSRLGVELVVRGSYSVVPGGRILCFVSVSTPEGTIVARKNQEGRAAELFDLVRALTGDVVDVLAGRLGRPRPDSQRTLSASAAPPGSAIDSDKKVADAESLLTEARLLLAQHARRQDRAGRKELERLSEEARDGEMDLRGKAGKDEIPGRPAPAPESTQGEPKADQGAGDSPAPSEQPREVENAQVPADAEPAKEVPERGAVANPALEAIQRFSRAQLLLERKDRGARETREAIELLRQAVELDPGQVRYVRELRERLEGLRDTKAPNGETNR